MKKHNNYVKNRSKQQKLNVMTSSSAESEINDVNEDPLLAIDFSDDDDNNNATNEVNSLEKAEENKGQKEVDDD